MSKNVVNTLLVGLIFLAGCFIGFIYDNTSCGQIGSPSNRPLPMYPGSQPGATNQRLSDVQTRVDKPASSAPMALPPQQGGYDYLTPEEKSNIRVYENTNRSVVNITTRSVRSDWFFSDSVSEGEGSGCVFSKAGYVLTNFHVVAGANEVRITLFNGISYDAEVVGLDPSNDIAVMKIQAPPKDLFPVELGNSAELRVGQKIYAIGNPFGLERTLTVGIISSLNRTLPSRQADRTIKQVIQIDAAINPGNSGGPLMDSRGMMVGMNTAIASKTGQSAGVGFAIPSNTIARIVNQLIKYGHVIRPNIGIEKAFQTDYGLLIAQMEPGGPAERANLRGPEIVRRPVRTRSGKVGYMQALDRSKADLIISVDGRKVLTADDFLTAIETRRPGDVVELGIIREGKTLTVRVELEKSTN